MRWLRKLGSLPASEWRLLVEALGLLLTVRTGLSLGLYSLQRRMVARCLHSRPSAAPRIGLTAECVALAVRRASRIVPGATCLAQALAGQVLLARAGHLSTLRIGVARRGHDGISAHAWVESGGRVVIGGEGVDQYTEFPDLAERLRPATASGVRGGWTRQSRSRMVETCLPRPRGNDDTSRRLGGVHAFT